MGPAEGDGVHAFESGNHIGGERANARRDAAAARRIDDSGEDLNREHAGAFGDTGDRFWRGWIVAGRDPCDVRAVKAVGQRAGHGGAGTDLLIEAVRAQRLADSGFGLRKAGFLYHFSSQERVCLVHARIQHGDHRAGAVIAGAPRLIGFDERRAVE